MIALHLALITAFQTFAAPAPDPIRPLTDRTCPTAATRCAGLRLHIAATTTGLPTWLETQLDETNRLFAVADLGFVPVAVTQLPPELATITTRADRDALGHDRFAPDAIDVYIVSHLADVDVPGQEIRGVHWRSRRDRTRRFIILSTISSPMVLAHELGHYFGLPHSKYPESIMNKTPRPDPPSEERRFASAEVRRIMVRAKSLIRSGALVNQATPPSSPSTSPRTAQPR